MVLAPARDDDSYTALYLIAGACALVGAALVMPGTRVS